MPTFTNRWKSLPCKYRDQAVIFAKNLVNRNCQFFTFPTFLSRNESHFFMFMKLLTQLTQLTE